MTQRLSNRAYYPVRRIEIGNQPRDFPAAKLLALERVFWRRAIFAIMRGGRERVGIMDGRVGFAITLALLGTLMHPADAQVDLPDMIPRCDGKFGLCGYIDRATTQEVIASRFERA